jgi:hypothetical protein
MKQATPRTDPPDTIAKAYALRELVPSAKMRVGARFVSGVLAAARRAHQVNSSHSVPECHLSKTCTPLCA